MKQTYSLLMIGLLMISSMAFAYGQSSNVAYAEEFEEWKSRRTASVESREAFETARDAWQADKENEELREAYFEAAKERLINMLTEAEAWLNLQLRKINSNEHVSDELKEIVANDVADGLARISELKEEAADIATQIDVLTVSLKIIGGYFEVTADVMKNSGLAWVEVSEEFYIANAEEFLSKLRLIVEDREDAAILNEKLDEAQAHIDAAKEHVNTAEGFYLEVEIGNQPLIKFKNGNMELRMAKAELQMAAQLIKELFRELQAN